ncbi:glycosyltransferase family 4 protein [Chloroflexota bacterium]
MNILFCDPLQLPGSTKRNTHVLELVSNLQKAGHNVVCIHPMFSQADGKMEHGQKNSTAVQFKWRLSSLRVLRPFVGELAILWFLLRETRTFFLIFSHLVKQRRLIDVIYRRHSKLNSEYLLAKLFNVPSVKELNGIIADEVGISETGNKFSQWIVGCLESFNMSKADKIITVTQQLKEVLRDDYQVSEGKLVAIPNGANTELFQSIARKQARKTLNINRNGKFVIFSGTLAAWQGIGNLVRSIPLVLERCPDTLFLIVGDGPLRPELENLARQTGVTEKIIFTGNIPYEEVPLYINASDICVAPFIGERNNRCGLSPLKIVEYMACAKPVILSRIPGLEYIEANIAGILVQPDNINELADAIVKLLNNDSLSRQMGKNGEKYAVKNLSWESVAGRVADVCQQTIEEHKAKHSENR